MPTLPAPTSCHPHPDLRALGGDVLRAQGAQQRLGSHTALLLALGLRFSTSLRKPLGEEVRAREPSWAVPESTVRTRLGRPLSAAQLEGQGHGTWPPGCGDPGTGPGSREVLAKAPPPSPLRALGGREGAGASGSPSDGEMWPFTFTLQCQHLNHCLCARAQGCSPASRQQSHRHRCHLGLWAQRRGAPPPPQVPRRTGLLASSLPPPFLSSFFLPSLLFPLFWGGVGGSLKDLSQGPGGHRVTTQTHQEPGV